ncbi:MAG TPA: metal-dependent hydrolase [Verrucomicrobiae bacterium]|nr:metal-dependent hydrolase [Verrucomicrobiae bacterium]
MDLLTQALALLAAARAGRKWLPRFGVAALVAAGIVPNLDSASYWGGAGSYLRYHRGALHGIAGASVAACAIAGLACLASRKFSSNQVSNELRFPPAVVAAALGIFIHLTLDFCTAPGVMFLWPWSMRWWGCEIVKALDPYLLILLAGGILLPELFHLVSEEIGERRPSGPRGVVAAMVALALAAGYLGFRAELRTDAIRMLSSREYHRRPPTSADAFPDSANPFLWRGVVSTDATIEEVTVPVENEDEFEPDRSMTLYKPVNSPALQIAGEARDAKRFLMYARFPFARVTENDEGFTVEFRDLRFPPSDTSANNMTAFVVLNHALQIESQGFRFPSAESR